jgi:predicted nuclease of predicted toxin-antitoxin system
MNFLLDENFPKSAKKFLDERGHNVTDVRDALDEGADDVRVFELAQQRHAILLTTDRDFYHTIPWLYDQHFGVVVIALRQPNRKAILDRMEWLIAQEDLFPLTNKVIQLRDSTFRLHQSDY